MSIESNSSPFIRQTEHVQLVKYQGANEYVTVESASICCNDFVDLCLTCENGHLADKVVEAVQMKISKPKENLLIAYLGITLPSVTTIQYRTFKIDSFEDRCACISQLLSIKDKVVYVVVSATLGYFIVPLIHDHLWIEYIYIYQDSNDQEPIDWINDYSKIRINESSMDLLTKKVGEDIDTIVQRPSQWSRSKVLLTELCAQTSQIDISLTIDKAIKGDQNTWRIKVLHLDSTRLVHLFHPQITIDEFHNIIECIMSIKTEKVPVFLVISMNCLTDIRLLAESNTVYAIYIVGNLNSEEQIKIISTYSKVSGIFKLNEDLLGQLTRDICFYRHLRTHTSTISHFRIKSNILENLIETHTDFLSFTLFTDILSQLPSPLITTNDYDSINNFRLLSRLIDINTQITYLFNHLDVSTLQKSISELKSIHQKVISMTKNDTLSFDTAYRVQILSQKDIERMQNNSNNLLTIQGFVLASLSFQSAADICHEAASNQLTVALLSIELTNKALVASVDASTVVFTLGTIFQIVSATLGPDDVWRIKLEIADTAMQRIKNQLRIEIGSYLTWMTFGNYLATFKRFTAAQEYYKYLQQVLPSEHPSLASIYNNMALVYSEARDDKIALDLFKKALKMKTAETSVTDKQERLTIFDLQLSTDSCTPVNKITILNKIAEIAFCVGDRATSLEYYRQALQIATDPASRHFYQAKIEALLSVNENSNA